MRVTAKPGVGTSTMKQLQAVAARGGSGSASVTAKTVIRSATEPWLMNRFEPLRT